MNQQRIKASLSAPRGLGNGQQKLHCPPVRWTSATFPRTPTTRTRWVLVQRAPGPGDQTLPQVWRLPSAQPNSITSYHVALRHVECMPFWWPSVAAKGMWTHSSSTQ